MQRNGETNKITEANAGGPHQPPVRKSWTARIAQFFRQAANEKFLVTPNEFIRDYETSGRTRGLDYTLSLIDRDAVYWFSDGNSHVGKSAIERVIRRHFELIKDEELVMAAELR